MTPILLVLLDGLGDRADPALGGRTTNEVAHTPNLDRFAADAANGLISPLGRGRAPASELAHWTYFTGALDDFPGRSVLEALGRGRAPTPDDVLGYVALRGGRHDPEAEVVRLGTRPGRGDEAEATALLDALPTDPFDGIGFAIDPLDNGDALLWLEGDVDQRISDTDSFEDDLHPLLACQPLVTDAAAVRTAAAVNAWTQACHQVLAAHPVNLARRDHGLAPFDVATTKWWSRRRPVVPFPERTGMQGALVSAAAYQGGMAALLGLEWARPPTAAPGHDSLAARLALSDELLGRLDFVHCHDKTPDEAGHTKRPEAKIAAMESLDTALGDLPDQRDVVTVVTGDHATPSVGRMLHSGDAVPCMLAGRDVGADDVTRFGERHQARGSLGHFDGVDLLPLALNAADRARFLGARAGARPPGAPGAGPATPLRLPGPS